MPSLYLTYSEDWRKTPWDAILHRCTAATQQGVDEINTIKIAATVFQARKWLDMLIERPSKLQKESYRLYKCIFPVKDQIQLFLTSKKNLDY